MTEQIMWGMKAKLKREAKQLPIIKKKVEQLKPKVVEVKPVEKIKPKKYKTGNKYKAVDKAHDIHKKVFNQKIADEIRNIRDFKKGTAVVLDAETMLTYKALISAGYLKNKIDEVNFCPETYEAIKKIHSNTFYTSLGEYIKSAPKYSLSTVVADYMCSVIGNKDVRPLEEVKYMFDNKLFAKGSLLAITLSWRAGPNVPSNYGSLMKLLNVITIGAYKNGYDLIITPDGQSYNNGGSMFYIICHLW